MSVWTDIPSLGTVIYRGDHVMIMRRRETPNCHLAEKVLYFLSGVEHES